MNLEDYKGILILLVRVLIPRQIRGAVLLS